jgi:acetyltransferase-like isoleucine patch superfamily enzyme
MTFHEELNGELDALCNAALAEPGLFPVWNPNTKFEEQDGATIACLAERNLAIELDPQLSALIESRDTLAARPARDWPVDLLVLFRLGLVYLRDASSEISPTAQFDHAFRVVIRKSRIGHFTVIERGPIVIADSFVLHHNLVLGPAAVLRSTLHVHCYVGRGALIRDSFFASYAKAQVSVKVDGSLIGAYAGLDGGTHPEQYPLNPVGRTPAGVVVAEHNWVGHHAALLAGTRTGAGVVVGTGVAVAKEVSPHVMLLGSPPRALPVDYHIRGLEADEAYAAGAAQGPAAAVLPIYGAARAGFTSPRLVEVEYPDHGLARQLVGARLLDFQRGALTAMMKELLPQHDVEVRVVDGEHVRFAISISPPIDEPRFRLGADVELSLRAGAAPSALSEDERAIFDFIARAAVTFHGLNLAVGEPDSGIGPMTEQAVFDAVHRLSDLELIRPRLLRWPRRTNHREDALLAAFADISGARRLPTAAPAAAGRA